MELPFELDTYHKSDTKRNWKKRGLTMDKFEEIYQQYIYSSHCELCKKKFENTRDRQMDHSHQTGEFRNIVCQSCNRRKRDVKMSKNNKSGYKYIHEAKDSRVKQGFYWRFDVQIDGKRKQLKSSVDIEKVIQFRDQWFKDNPKYHT